ncbi:cation:proton antiporter subunit C [Saliphagus infecundisoli]|uniref:Cation:proton antiporter subunit C n=1 Tax=Saliphagus infecundisoli TaxID=1849069 RepID=A0ABD5QIM1_9EURY|nr:cation:proton antiporter subunit C [Saliphagus infecundisoli]
MIEALFARYNYVVFALLLGIGLYIVIDDENLVKKVIGLNVFQTGIFLFFITVAVQDGAEPAVTSTGEGTFVNPLPHVLILTAIVVGVSLTALALALVVRIHEEYGSIREDVVVEVLERD